jgi:hypothetical protein
MASSTAPQRCEVLDIEDTHERVRLCTCGESKNGLLCDDSHVKLNARTNANVQVRVVLCRWCVVLFSCAHRKRCLRCSPLNFREATSRQS